MTFLLIFATRVSSSSLINHIIGFFCELKRSPPVYYNCFENTEQSRSEYCHCSSQLDNPTMYLAPFCGAAYYLFEINNGYEGFHCVHKELNCF